MANLAAQWGVEKMIIRAEQVNRFMVFYKAWMIYDSIREAGWRIPTVLRGRGANRSDGRIQAGAGYPLFHRNAAV